jgi:aconitate hydratase A / 2-methylisocitrate dehydratase
MTLVESSPEYVSGVYERMRANIDAVRKRAHPTLTLAEKVLFGHLTDPKNQVLKRGEAYLYLRPDRVVMQDATAQMAFLQFAQSGVERVAVPTTVHCDHLIVALKGSKVDLDQAVKDNFEVYEFLRTAAKKYGAGFWRPGSGIIHQVALENYCFPGGLMIGTDSHTPNGGGLGMAAIGVGGADAAEVMAGLPWEVLQPRIVGVKLTGEMKGWTSPKDVILKLCGILTVKGGTNAIIEYFGPGCKSISATGKGTICNMGAELGATTSVFPYDERMATYLKATNRAPLAALAEKNRDLLAADPDVERAPEKYFDRVVEIDLSKLEPHVVGPHTPDLARTVSDLKTAVPKEGYVNDISVALIGSCTNSSYEDMERAASIARQAAQHGLKMKIPLLVTPGSETIRKTIERDGQMKVFESIGATVLANACGPCIGQWSRPELRTGQKNTIVTSYNRNFRGRNDGNSETAAFMGSPEVVVAYGLSGHLSFDPVRDTLVGGDGKPFKLQPPPPAPEVPPTGFATDRAGYEAPAEDGGSVQIALPPGSQRLQLLPPFEPWNGKDFQALPILLKTKGKTTTDQISPAGPWLRFRGHLDKISDNMFVGAVNAFTGAAGTTENQLTGEKGLPVPAVARAYKAKGRRWIVVGDENYGEGSSREHAAMSPRYLGCAAVLARSFARIHETNLKKQGVLPLTFMHAKDYDLVNEENQISILGLASLRPGEPLLVKIHHKDGTTMSLPVKHSLNAEQTEWFRAGSALNYARRRRSAAAVKA